MGTLDAAWAWYVAARDGAKRLSHLAKFWDDFPWAQDDAWVKRVERDNVLRHVSGIDLTDGARALTAELDDLAVLVLFSVFEAQVRQLVREQVEPEVAGLRHPSLVHAGEEVLEALAQGSFGRMLQAFKLTGDDKNLVEQVNQIRAYRNWVAHGRREDMRPSDTVIPKDARDRLQAFLDRVRELPTA